MSEMYATINGMHKSAITIGMTETGFYFKHIKCLQTYLIYAQLCTMAVKRREKRIMFPSNLAATIHRMDGKPGCTVSDLRESGYIGQNTR